jgi:hypothetical protein
MGDVEFSSRIWNPEDGALISWQDQCKNITCAKRLVFRLSPVLQFRTHMKRAYSLNKTFTDEKFYSRPEKKMGSMTIIPECAVSKQAILRFNDDFH